MDKALLAHNVINHKMRVGTFAPPALNFSPYKADRQGLADLHDEMTLRKRETLRSRQIMKTDS